MTADAHGTQPEPHPFPWLFLCALLSTALMLPLVIRDWGGPLMWGLAVSGGYMSLGSLMVLVAWVLVMWTMGRRP